MVHTHLDWHDSRTWLETFDSPVRLAWDGERLCGMIAASVPMDGTSWLRLIGIADHTDSEALFKVLWHDIRAILHDEGVHTVAVLVIDDWLTPYVTRAGFSYEEDIITLRREGKNLPPLREHTLSIRHTAPEDIRRITEVDQRAFVAPWQLTFADLRQAKRIAASCTVAEYNGEIVGYQLSTLFRHSGHLARLAVLPEMQGKGVGSVLLDDLIQRFLRRSIATVTVNTQSSNIRSQRVYERYGFSRNGYDLPVWMTKIR